MFEDVEKPPELNQKFVNGFFIIGNAPKLTKNGFLQCRNCKRLMVKYTNLRTTNKGEYVMCLRCGTKHIWQKDGCFPQITPEFCISQIINWIKERGLRSIEMFPIHAFMANTEMRFYKVIEYPPNMVIIKFYTEDSKLDVHFFKEFIFKMEIKLTE